jgi:hypothetical protein
MRRIVVFFAAVLAGYPINLVAQNPHPADIKLADVVGTWEGKTMVGPKDSVGPTYLVTATANGKGWTLKFPNRDAIATRVVATGGDSIVTETGPYSSILRPGQTVTTLRIVGHYKGSKMTGTFEAHYASGDVVRGKAEAMRKT